MYYRNKNTGAIINVTCSVKSDFWEPVETTQPAPVVEEQSATEDKALVRKKKVK